METVTERLSELADTLRVRQLMINLQFRNLRKETVFYKTQRFPTEVIPQLRDRHEEWEDHWWPKDALSDPATPARLPESAEV